ncbi:LuxR C-terminal-related transcriptional regulator [Archangium sp.]|jgi:DNA-binding CsgD family transcriptional regulator|uniref:LuxR C-terminal-related transcriptional regulator n=1 Tax=Archangium sp. TaxID=1872627 RepID=UPI002EDB7008
MNSQDQRLLEDLRALIDVVEPGKDVLPLLVEALREALHAERGLMYGVDVGPKQYQTSFAHSAGFPSDMPSTQPYLNGILSSLRDPWGYFNPARPEPAQRNRVVQFIPLEQAAAPTAPPRDERLAPWRKLGISPEEQARMQARLRSSLGTALRHCGIDQMVYLRVLVCEDATMLGWTGVMRSEPFEEREQRLLRELTPALQRRLMLDTRLREAGLLNAALEVALDALGQPAYVVTATGRVAYANSSGRAQVDQGHAHVAEAVTRYARGEPVGEEFSISPLRITGTPSYYLAIERSATTRTSARVRTLGAHWKLTARETEVLGHLIRGESNKAISVSLGCAERTVEVHVTRILAKAQVESRSALIAKFFLVS